MVDVSLYPTAQGGRQGPVWGDTYGCPCKFDPKDFSGWDCRLLLRGEQLVPGQTKRFGIVFLTPQVAPVFQHVKKFYLWEGGIIGEAVVAPSDPYYEQQLALQPLRPLRSWERMLLSELLMGASLPNSASQQALDAYRVREMPDGGMGSLRFDRVRGASLRFGVSEFWYRDVDGVLVSFSLNLNETNEPWEIDAWKMDSTPLKRPPSEPSELSKREF